MKISREIVNFLFIFFIMIVMMIFFRLMNGLSTWISFFIPVFYGFMVFYLLYQKIKRKIIIYMPFILLMLGLMIFIIVLLIWSNRFDPNLHAMIAFILILFIIYAFLLTRAAIITLTYHSHHLERVMGFSLMFFIVLVFLSWSKYIEVYQKIILAFILVILSLFIIYLKDVIFKNTKIYVIKRTILSINMLLNGLYLVGNLSFSLIFLVILSNILVISCLLFKKPCSLFDLTSQDMELNFR